MYNAIIIGGGASGMMAAGSAAGMGKKVLLIEKNKILGKKLLITGKGRCNVTNIADTQRMMSNITSNGRFLYSAFSKMDSNDTINFFKGLGVSLKTERGGRVFPESDKSADIAGALKKYIAENNVEILNGEAAKIIVKDGQACGVKLTDGNIYESDSVVIATGGLSYPSTGSTGDGLRLAKECGHSIIDTRPALVPIIVKEKWVLELQGLSLKNVKLRVYCDGKEIFSDFGEMLFTHFGVSGPIALSSSCHMKEIGKKIYVLSVDLKPALDAQTIEARVIKDFNKNINRDYINSLSELLPQKLIPVIIKLSGIEPHTKVNQITKEQRNELCYLLKNLEFQATSLRSYDEAIITAGGVCTKEINPSTMESRLIKGLYFAGEVIDVDAYTGGYNLQIAFSTGYLAGLSC